MDEDTGYKLVSEVDSAAAVDILSATTERGEGGKFAPLEDGLHEAIIVGAVVREQADFNDKTKLSNAVTFVLQIVDGEDVHYVHSKSFTSMYLYSERSNFYKMLKGITKISGVDDDNYVPRLEQLGLVVDVDGTKTVKPSNFLGLHVQILVTTESKPNGKSYPEIVGYKPSSKTNKPKVDSVSSRVFDYDGNAKGKLLVPEITLTAPKTKAEVPIITADEPF